MTLRLYGSARPGYRLSQPQLILRGKLVQRARRALCLLKGVRRQSFLDSERRHLRETLARLADDATRLAEDAASVGFRGLSFDPFPFDEGGLTASEVDIGRRKIAQALVAAQVSVVGDDGADLGLEVARQVVALEQDSVLERLMPALDLALEPFSDKSRPGIV